MRIPFLITISLGILLTASVNVSAGVVYSENFNVGPAPSTTGGIGSGTVFSLNSAYNTTGFTPATELNDGWAAFSTSSATDISNIAVTGIADRQSPNGPTSGADQYGFLVGSGGSIAPLLIATSSLSTLSISTTLPGLSFNWLQGDQTATDNVKLAIQVSGLWYASTADFTTAAQAANQFGASPSTTAEAKSLLFAGASWNALTFSPGVSLNMGSLTTPPSGAITGIGFFLPNTLAANTRFDSLTITSTAVPEPSTYALLCGGVVFLSFAIRRHRMTAAMSPVSSSTY